MRCGSEGIPKPIMNLLKCVINIVLIVLHVGMPRSSQLKLFFFFAWSNANIRAHALIHANARQKYSLPSTRRVTSRMTEVASTSMLRASFPCLGAYIILGLSEIFKNHSSVMK